MPLPMSLIVSPAMLLAIGLFCALWLAAAVWALVRGLGMQRRAAFAATQTERLGQMVEASPALPVLIRADWRIDAGSKLALWLGLADTPAQFDDLAAVSAGLETREHEALRKAVVGAQRGGKVFTLTLRPHGSRRTLVVRGSPAGPPIGGPGAVLLWLFDATESEDAIGALAAERDEAVRAFDALSGLIEAAPFPMWFRDPRFDLTLVNRAYVGATEADSAIAVIAGGTELVETVAGVTPVEAAHRAHAAGAAQDRTVPVTVAGARRMMRVVDVPLYGEGGALVGVAGYAIDIQDLEVERAEHRRFVEVQRDMLDRMSAAVAQFGPDRALRFANQPFRRLFALDPAWVAELPDFARLLDRLRDGGRTPEVRDFPEWRVGCTAWFSRPDATEDEWLLRDGTHLRLVAQPMPDGGLVLIVEDRTEQVQLASARDTLLRVRTATFDNLFEAVAVFAPDGRLHLWNQRFRRLWGADESLLAAHPRVDALMAGLADRLAKPQQVAIIQEIIRTATLERQQRAGKIGFRDGRHFDFASIPLPDGNALLIMLDVTDSRRAETALRERNEALEAADKVKTAFLSRMSYELRTPLTSIGGFAEMLKGGYAGTLEPTAIGYVGAILESVDVLGRQIDNVLDLAQGEAGTLAIDRAEVALDPLLRAAALAQGEKIELVIQIDPAVGVLGGDARRLRQIVDQLLDNAIR
ncbi:MAG: hypothetical protein RLZZ58_757, partial [Pseudomonadota bacterium]